MLTHHDGTERAAEKLTRVGQTNNYEHCMIYGSHDKLRC